MEFLKMFTNVYGRMLLKVIECTLIQIKLVLDTLLDIVADTKTILIRLTK